MKKLTVLIIVCIALIHSMLAQIGKVGINTTTPSAMLHVKDSSVLFTGPYPYQPNPGPVSVSGAGTRMMWYSSKAAFRAGMVDGQQWDKDSIGHFSVATGYNTRASGQSSLALGQNIKIDGNFSTGIGANLNITGNQSFALGINNTVSNNNSTAIGSSNLASGTASLAIGSNCTSTGFHTVAIGYQCNSTGSSSLALGELTNSTNLTSTSMGKFTSATETSALATGFGTTASGYASSSFGEQTQAKGSLSAAFGRQTISKPFASFVIGRFNDTTSTNSMFWVDEDPLFIIGNGTGTSDLKNALTVLKNGKTGFNTISPDAMLHVSEGTGGSIYNSGAEVIIEDDAASYLQFSNPTSFESGILSGNSLSSLRSAIIFRADSSVQIRAGGGTTRIHVRADGNVGIGTIAPQRLFHVKNGTGGNSYHGNAELVIEDNDATYLQFSSLTADESGILSGNEVSSLRSAIMFRPDSSVQIRTGGNTTRITVSKTGNTGIGTSTPEAKLDVSGTAIIGANGTSLTEIIKVTVLKDVASIAAGTSLTVDYTVANSATTSTVYISPESDLANGLIIAYARVNAAGTVRAKFTNITGAAIDPPSMNYYITVIR